MSAKKKKERTILIGVDDNEESEFAFDFYVHHLHRPGNKVVLLHVVKPFIMSTNDNILENNKQRDHALTAEKQLIKKIQAQYTTKMRQFMVPGRINIESHSKKPGKLICQLAAEDHCNFIVVGVRQAMGKTTLQSSSVLEYLLEKAKCPVVVARMPQPPELQSLVVDRRPSKTDQPTEERRRRVSAPSRLFDPASSLLNTEQHGPGSAQPIGRAARQRSQSTITAPSVDQLALLHDHAAAVAAGKLTRRLSVKYEEEEDDAI